VGAWKAAAVVLSAAWQTSPVAALGSPAFEAGRAVEVRVDVDGRAAPLFPAPDGSGRLYLEARRGHAYSVSLSNRSDRRLGVELRIDGLNAISGERTPEGERGRLYVLPPRGGTTIHGWRSSLERVHRFEFVDEAVSYAARSSRWNPRLGWIEVAVYRERQQRRPVRILGSDLPETSSPAHEPASDEVEPRAEEDRARRAHPGTGWGHSLEDRAILVSFDPEPEPRERVTLRYEYAPALRALGVLPPAWDRLAEREHGGVGFAQPPDR
jgi:hypothetical protein